MGTEAGSPYTVAEELNTMFFTPWSAMAFTRFRVPVTLLW